MKKFIKNYTTQIPLEKTIGEIQTLLSQNGAIGIAFDYSDTGKLKAIYFRIKYKDKDLPFRLPANPEAVYQELYAHKRGAWRYEKQRKIEADMIAWRVVKLWVEAQITHINLGQAKIHEAFLAYLVVGQNQTLFQKMEENQMLLSSPNN